MTIKSINSVPINNVGDYTNEINFFNFTQNQKIEIQTTTSSFIVFTNQTPEVAVSNVPKTNLKTGLDLSGGARAMLRPVNVTLSRTKWAI